METTGQKIKSLRRGKDISQEELADALGVSRQAVSKWEQDKMLLTLENLKEISKFFGVTMESLVATDGSALEEKRLSEKEAADIIEKKIVDSISSDIASDLEREVRAALQQEVAAAIKNEGPELSDDTVEKIKDSVVVTLKKNIAVNLCGEFVAHKEQIPKMKRPSKAWILGVILSLLFPIGDLIAYAVVSIIDSLPLGFDRNAWGSYSDWVIHITIIIFTVISLCVFVSLITYRIVKFVIFKKKT